LSGGGYAERVVVPAGQLLPLPDELAFEEAAALPEALCTVWMCLDLARARPGERWLVHAAASGIGTTALMAARELGLRTFALASADKLDRCLALGAEGVADRRGDWVAAVKSWAPQGVDLVLDPIAGESLARDQQVLGMGGRIVVIGLMGGASSMLDAGRLLVKRQQVLGTVLRARDDADKARIVAGVLRDLWTAVVAGRLRPVVDAVFPIEEAEAAHARISSDRTVGKVVLRVG
ncbi:MAG: zinc-binding dehydrogenase, partial [Myxococcales bacterium]|nr:zinc-binding dehydrogenase [Myxococcales bacterium]